jgi:hypothetical protein
VEEGFVSVTPLHLDPHGALLEEFPPKSEPVISPETAFLVTSMLKSVVERGTARGVAALGRPVAGKTGTTNDFHDAWFIGYTPELVTGVWVGYDSERSLGKKQTGGRVAAPIFLAYMQAALGDAPVTDFAIPEGISCVNMDTAVIRRGADAVECFKEGSAPHSQYVDDGLSTDELDSAIGRLRLRSIGARRAPDLDEPVDDEPWPDGVEVIERHDWGRPLTEDYLPAEPRPDDRIRAEHVDDDVYRARLRRRLRRELADADYRPVHGDDRADLNEESHP